MFRSLNRLQKRLLQPRWQHNVPEYALPDIRLPTQPENPKSLTVAIIGLPNAGKSTLMNSLSGQKISIVSPKVQTTKERVLGVITEGNTQIEVLDTPGILSHQDGRKLRVSRTMLTEPRNAVLESDLILSLIDVDAVLHSRRDLSEFVPVINLKGFDGQSPLPNVFVLNKMDRAQRKGDVDGIVEELKQIELPYAETDWSATFFISALSGQGVPNLKTHLFDRAVFREWRHAVETVTDQSRLKRFEEAVREQLFLHLRQELPYSLFQRPGSWRTLTPQDAAHILVISHTIVAKSLSQKVIVIGKKGRIIQQITRALENQMSKDLGIAVKIHLTVDLASDNELRRKGV